MPARLGAGAALLLAAVLSGVAALGLELVWVRILGLAFGSETFGMLGVLTGFFGGLSIGAALFHRRIVASARPALVYVAAELVVAAYALAGPWILLPLVDALPAWLGPLIGDNRSIVALAVNLAVATVVLLPATIAMGATTAALVEAWQRRRDVGAQASTVAWLYAANTLGATAGVIVCIDVLLPRLGVPAASAMLGAFGVAAAVLVARWERTRNATPASASVRDIVSSSGGKPARRLAYALLFFTGLAGIGLETVGSHVLAQVFENTVHTFANILAVYLLGTAAGAWLYAAGIAPRMGTRRDDVTAALLLALALSGALAAALLAQAGVVTAWIAPPGAPYARRMAAEAVATLLAFGAPTVAMGATFSHLAGAFTERGIGYALAVNTLGASLAAFVFGLVLIPAAGYGVAFHATVAIDIALFAVAAALARRHLAMLGGTALACVGAALTFSPLVLVHFPATTALLAQHVSLQGVVSVTEDRRGAAEGTAPPRVLQVDQRFLMGGTPGFVTQRMGQLPMLLARDPRDVLYLGVGTGITAGAALDFPVRHVTGVELLPQVLDTLRWFTPANRDLAHDPRVTLHASDARRFVRAARDRYDVIVADLYHPSRDGTSALYTREHYSNIRGRLRPGGLFVQWLPLYQLRPDDLRTIVRTFVEVFPQAHSALGNYSGNARFALLAWAPDTPRDATALDVPTTAARLAQVAARAPVYDGIADLLAAYMLDADALQRYAGAGPLNTDATQRITFDAAGAVSDTDAGTGTLASLLALRRPFPDAFVGGVDPAGRAALRADAGPYADAVRHYLDGEVLRAGAADGRVPPSAVDAYLAAYAADRRFAAAVGKLLETALQDPDNARALVLRVGAIHPDDAAVDALRRRVQDEQDPAAVRRIVARFLATGGE